MWTLYGMAAVALAGFHWLHGPAARHAFAGAFGLCLGMATVAGGAAGVQTGSILVLTRTARRDEQPITFWGTVAVHLAGGLVLSLGVLYWLLFA